MRSQEDLLRKLVGSLEDLGISYMLTGSISSSFHGEARATNDVDIVIAPSKAQIEKLLSSLGPDFYSDRQAALDALARADIFNIVDMEGGWKVDFMIRKERPFSREEFSRRTTVRMGELLVSITTSEDAILSKLEWAKSSHSERQYQDALGVALVNRDDLDRDYLRRWAEELGLDQLLEKLLTEVDQA